MQQPKNPSHPPFKPPTLHPATRSAPKPLVLDDKALRNVTGGVNVPASPNGGW
jgi:hypothetical protein